MADAADLKSASYSEYGFESHVGYVITYIDYVSDESGDWHGIYVNFQSKYQDHSIPDFIWLDILKQVSGTQIEIRKWETAMDNETYTSYPIEFMDLAMFSTQYQLKGTDGADACAVTGK